MVSKADRLARSLPDARGIADELAAKRWSLGGSLANSARVWLDYFWRDGRGRR